MIELDKQARQQARVTELDIEVHEEEFDYWHRHDKAARRKP